MCFFHLESRDHSPPGLWDFFLPFYLFTNKGDKFMESANSGLLCKALGISKWMRTHPCPVEAHSLG